jgi:hypothetical protein
VIVLRAVSDVVDAPGGDPTYHDEAAWQRAAAAVMGSLIALLGEAAPELPR